MWLQLQMYDTMRHRLVDFQLTYGALKLCNNNDNNIVARMTKHLDMIYCCTKLGLFVFMYVSMSFYLSIYLS